MGLFSKRSRDKPQEQRSADGKMQDFIKGIDVDQGGGVASGQSVDELRAMQTSAVYACVRVLAETIASLPCYLYKREKSSGGLTDGPTIVHSTDVLVLDGGNA